MSERSTAKKITAETGWPYQKALQFVRDKKNRDLANDFKKLDPALSFSQRLVIIASAVHEEGLDEDGA